MECVCGLINSQIYTCGHISPVYFFPQNNFIYILFINTLIVFCCFVDSNASVTQKYFDFVLDRVSSSSNTRRKLSYLSQSLLLTI